MRSGEARASAAGRRRRWPIVAGSAVAAGALIAAVAVPLAASAQVDLPDKTAAELVEFAAGSDVEAMTGTIEQSSELGLPDLQGLFGDEDGPGADGGSAAGPADVLDLLIGSHTANIYRDEDRVRLQVLDRLAERNVYVDGEAGEGWFVDSETQTATRFALTGDRDALAEHLESLADAKRAAAEEQLGMPMPTPEQILDDALAQLDESTDVSVGTDGRVAGREVYELVLQPRTDDTLVGEVRFAIDGQTGAALAASVTARGADEPAFRVGFTDVSFEAPPSSDLEFVPADGFTVVEKDIALPTPEQLDQARQEGAPDDGSAAEHERPIVHGDGWSAVIELPSSDGLDGSSSAGSADDTAMLDRLTTEVAGGRVLETALVTVLFADDGRVFAGAVTPERLAAVAAGDG
ncbi:hypothetical protein G5T42_16290 [Microbacterium sp. 4R-513]|uniref:LolA family protein n=1 Tax=Microbacterium sp. 4R-513 TaxID=2567934 RepID=UPI0013E144C4|nr:hypothetical protein [Microbacterium sp. 4R-513]QIG40840.1 hypothetical protein G5T42_16290 [Microbacterium sp. 4R-513]